MTLIGLSVVCIFLCIAVYLGGYKNGYIDGRLYEYRKRRK